MDISIDVRVVYYVILAIIIYAVIKYCYLSYRCSKYNNFTERFAEYLKDKENESVQGDD